MSDYVVYIEQFFHSAGKIYGWGEKVYGIGINHKIIERALELNQDICIIVKSDPSLKYKISPKKAIEVGITKWEKFDNLLLIIPKTACEEIQR